MDRMLVTEPRSEALLDDLDGAEISYLDPSGSGQWLPQWPPVQQANSAPPGMFPAAIRITLHLKDWGEIYRYVEVAR